MEFDISGKGSHVCAPYQAAGGCCVPVELTLITVNCDFLFIRRFVLRRYEVLLIPESSRSARLVLQSLVTKLHIAKHDHIDYVDETQGLTA